MPKRAAVSIEEFETEIASNPQPGPIICHTCNQTKPRTNFWRWYDNPDPDRLFALACKECMGSPKPADDDYHRFLNYIHRLEANGIEPELQELRDAQTYLDERKRWLISYVKHTEKMSEEEKS